MCKHSFKTNFQYLSINKHILTTVIAPVIAPNQKVTFIFTDCSINICFFSWMNCQYSNVPACISTFQLYCQKLCSTSFFFLAQISMDEWKAYQWRKWEELTSSILANLRELAWKGTISDLISLNAFLHVSLYYHKITMLGNKENTFYFLDL